MLECLFKKVIDLKACNFIKKRLQRKCFPVKFCKFSRTIFFYRIPPVAASGRESEGTSIARILQSCHFNICGINHRCFREIIMNNRDCRNIYRFSCFVLISEPKIKLNLNFYKYSAITRIDSSRHFSQVTKSRIFKNLNLGKKADRNFRRTFLKNRFRHMKLYSNPTT